MKSFYRNYGAYKSVTLVHPDGRQLTYFHSAFGLSIFVRDTMTQQNMNTVELRPDEEFQLRKFLAPQHEPTGDVTAGHGTGTT